MEKSETADGHETAAGGPVRRDYRPEGAAADSGAWATLKRTAGEFREDNLTDWAAALTYYGLLSLFPALIAMVSLLGLFGDPQTTTASLTEIITSIGPESAARDVRRADRLGRLQPERGGLCLRLRSARGALVGLRLHRRLHARLQRDLRDPEGRPFWKLRPLQVGVTW